MKWLYVFSRFELLIPDRNWHAPDRLIPFLISRNTDFIFPSDFPVPASILDQENIVARMVKGFFSDRSRPFSFLVIRKFSRYALEFDGLLIPCQFTGQIDWHASV